MSELAPDVSSDRDGPRSADEALRQHPERDPVMPIVGNGPIEPAHSELAARRPAIEAALRDVEAAAPGSEAPARAEKLNHQETVVVIGGFGADSKSTLAFGRELAHARGLAETSVAAITLQDALADPESVRSAVNNASVVATHSAGAVALRNAVGEHMGDFHPGEVHFIAPPTGERGPYGTVGKHVKTKQTTQPQLLKGGAMAYADMYARAGSMRALGSAMRFGGSRSVREVMAHPVKNLKVLRNISEFGLPEFAATVAGNARDGEAPLVSVVAPRLDNNFRVERPLEEELQKHGIAVVRTPADGRYDPRVGHNSALLSPSEWVPTYLQRLEDELERTGRSLPKLGSDEQQPDTS